MELIINLIKRIEVAKANVKTIVSKSIQWPDFYEGGIGEIIWFKSVLSTEEQNIVECYLSSKYRYPLDSNVVCP
ncbi:MAG: hypothetical protein MH321_15200 [Leptospiraceae bacterium]|nr:hypothetical protein [Leptospiraceae bacterium]